MPPAGECGESIDCGKLDIALEPSFPIRDGNSLHFRAEFFNFANTATSAISSTTTKQARPSVSSP